jgi:hypothetical protein
MVIREIPATSSSVIVDTTKTGDLSIPTFSTLSLNVHHPCSYCGGWTQPVGNTFDITHFQLTDPETGDIRKICVRCLIEAFDNILNPICRSKFLAGEIE